jgi:hypothetical protein
MYGRGEIQKPLQEINWGETDKFLKIKVGDRVWVGEGEFPCSKGIQTVTRLTNTLICVGKGRENWERFHRISGYQVGKRMFADHITGLATEDEIKSFEAKIEHPEYEDTDYRCQTCKNRLGENDN